MLALVCGLSGAVLAHEDKEPAPPAKVTITVTRGTGEGSDEGCTSDMPEVCTGTRPADQWSATDPRLSGTATTRAAEKWWPQGGDYRMYPVFEAYAVEVVNDEGRWVGTGRAAGPLDLIYVELTGEGAYEGLTAVLTVDPTDSDDDGISTDLAVIIEGDLPPFPEPVELTTPAEEPQAAVAPTATPAPETIGEPADDGARIIAVEEFDARTVDLTIDSPAVGEVKVRLLLPAGFEPGAEADWPVLYLLHGAIDDYTSWTRETDVAELTADLPLLVVMPEAGRDGWYADWWNDGTGGAPMWETFHLVEVPELLERNWQAGEDRVVAGVSMGGLGAMSYAGRHPELFQAAATFSGALHPVALDPVIAGFDFPPDLWGDRTAQAGVWAAHDPVELAPALAGIPLFVSYGTGAPGPLDPAETKVDELEAIMAGMDRAFVARLAELGIPVTVDAYGPGTHTWPYFERALHEAMPMLLEALGQ
jgi:S-formylglutathione hydrolase FrmB